MTEKTYCWGFFWENGEKAHLEFPFGPDHPNNIIYWPEDADGEWMMKAYAFYPKLKEMIDSVQDEWSLGFIVVNPPETVAD